MIVRFVDIVGIVDHLLKVAFQKARYVIEFIAPKAFFLPFQSFNFERHLMMVIPRQDKTRFYLYRKITENSKINQCKFTVAKVREKLKCCRHRQISNVSQINNT